MVVEALRVWGRTYPKAGDWRLVSLGGAHRPVELGPNLNLVSFGKVSLDEYSDHLLRSAVGLSLMISPHPSYPPLEMAGFGVRVVTNNFANKNLSSRSPFLNCVEEVTPARIAQTLREQCDAFESEGLGPIERVVNPFLGGDEEFPFAAELAALLTKG